MFDPSLLAPDPSAGQGGAPEEGDGGAGPVQGTPGDGSVPVEGGATSTECTDQQPSCSRPSALTTCFEGQCVVVACEDNFVDCDALPDNGCETTLTSVENCGLCGATCSLPNAVTDCESGSCRFSRCMPGYGNCDGDPENGCERPLDTINDCGECEISCEGMPNATPACDAGSCGVGECLGPYGDCDQAAPGCEQPLNTVAHCGGCDRACAPSNAQGSCQTGACIVESCDDDFVDCNGLSLDGCETTLDTTAHCGACGAACQLPRATRLRCEASGSGAACAVDHSCPPETEGCVEDAPENGCEVGYADCDGLAQNGCERRLDTLLDCGSCGATCLQPNAITACVVGQAPTECVFVECAPGHAQCGGQTCISLASDPNNCGACGNTCDGATPNCHGGRCTSADCPANRADCDQDGDCETNLEGLGNCGQCGVQCGPHANAGATCQNGRCALDGCDPGYRDCDRALQNGCEVDINSLDACGGCDQVCAIPFAQESCVRGDCEFEQCEPGRLNCNGDQTDGCETDATLPDNCGSCGLNCRGLPNTVGGGCNGGDCEITCQVGFGDCDGMTQSGCEADLSSETSCGSCNNDCTALANVVSATCSNGGLCEDLVCRDGFADCDGSPTNGCERSIESLSDCGGCGIPCALPHASASCATGACRVTECEPGFDDCNGSDADGCEASLTAPSSCGSCNNICPEGRPCENGKCLCTEASDCAAGLDCCDGECVDTRSVCSLWPCPIPSTARPILHCGGCGVYCPMAAAYFCCATL